MVLYELWHGETCFAEIREGLPTWRWRRAPAGLATRRQLRAAGLRPNGQEPYGQIVCRRGKRFGYLYRLDLAKPRREPSTAQLAAVGKALAARRRCRECGHDVGYCVPPVALAGRCWECSERVERGGVSNAA